MADTNAMREEEVSPFRESKMILDKLFEFLLGVIALKTTYMGEDLFITHHSVMMATVLMIVLYFLVWLLGTLLAHRSGIFLILSLCIIMVIGSVSSVLVLIIISPHIVCLTVLFWVGVFAVTAYYSYKKFYNLGAFAIFYIIKELIDSYRRHSTELPV